MAESCSEIQESSLAQSAEQKSENFRNKWKNAFKAVKDRGFALLKSGSPERDVEDPADKLLFSKGKLRLNKQTSDAAEGSKTNDEEVDPVYLLLKQATSLYPKSPTSRKNSIVHTGASVDSGLGSSVQLGSCDSDPTLKPNENEDDEIPTGMYTGFGKRKPPRLNAKMKSLSLDCGETMPPTTLQGKHKRSEDNLHKPKLSIPKTQKTHSFETSEGRSSTSCSPCPSPFRSNSSLPSASSVVTHEYRAKFPEELDLRLGERLILTDTTDQDWSHGFKVSDPSQRTGIFPAPCAAKIQPNERGLQVLQSINLCNGSKNLRLYRDQIIFGQGDINDDGMIMIRTERNYKALCPIQYLMFLD